MDNNSDAIQVLCLYKGVRAGMRMLSKCPGESRGWEGNISLTETKDTIVLYYYSIIDEASSDFIRDSNIVIHNTYVYT